MGPERLDRARTVESIAAVPASGRALHGRGAVLVRYPPRAAGLAAGAAVGLPGAPAGGHGELVFPAVDSAGRSVGAGGCNRPCVACIGIAPARGHPAWTGLRRGLPQTGRIKPVGLVERGADPAAGKQPRHGFRHRSRDPGLAASGRGSEHAPGDAAEPRAGHPLHPMVAGHATGQNRAAITAIVVLIATVFEWVNRGLPAGRRKPFSRPRPRHRKGPSLILSVARQDLAEAARLLCNFHACGPLPGSTLGVCRGSGFNLRDVFPTGCVAGRAEHAARSPGRGLRRGAELDRSRPQPVVDGVERFDQLVVPWILRIE